MKKDICEIADEIKNEKDLVSFSKKDKIKERWIGFGLGILATIVGYFLIKWIFLTK